jgi:DNA repair protein RadC
MRYAENISETDIDALTTGPVSPHNRRMKRADILSCGSRVSADQLGREISAVVFFGAHSEIVDLLTIEGSESDVVLPIREIVDRGFRASARRIMLWHTHPSGNPLPSAQDIIATRALCLALRRRHLRLADHLIFAGDRIFSFRANAML